MRAEESPVLGDTGPSTGLGDHPNSNGDVAPVRSSHAHPSEVTLAILRKSAAAFGLSLCCRCARCNAPLWNSRSVSAKLGPVCSRRVAAEASHG